jgi:NAD(P)-dependent dehydrogenase (short-subunit alcohol dehydrogenase family)
MPGWSHALTIRILRRTRPGGQVNRPVAVVTGANRGIGREVCRQLATRGFTVVAGARDEAAGERAAAAIDADRHADSHAVVAVPLDVADPASVRAAAERVRRDLGRVDALVNNAAIDYDTDQRAVSADLDRVGHALETNLLGAWRMTQAFLPLLRASERPRIVNVSSEAGAISEMTGGIPAYSVSKAALNALTRLLAGELRGEGVLVNAVCPGWTDTDMGRGGRPVAEGAASVVWAVLLDDDGPTGGFFRDGRALPW